MSKRKPTLKLQPVCEHGGFALHEDEDHKCVMPYGRAREGQNLAGIAVVTMNDDGTYEQIPTDAPSLDSPDHRGPAQVATDAYRESWERTFGARGGVS